ncbi:MAG: OmpH family outer membrane protein [Bacteroidota bacterium]|nr:OmpH family outer membrane protein [Bacteroidota bacterium]
MNFKIGLFALGLFMSALNANSQKFGYINSAQIIEAHPKVSGANTDLETYQKTMLDPFEVKGKAFQEKYKKYMEDANSGVMSQVVMEAKQNELRTEQQALQQEEQQLQFKILQKREELLKPILEEVDSIIQVLGKEGQYTMIFDTSVSGALLYAVEGDDLTASVKSKCMATKP